MPNNFEQYFTINGTVYWEYSLPSSADGELYHFDGIYRTKQQLENISTTCGYYIRGDSYSKVYLQSILTTMIHPARIGDVLFTKKQLEELLDSGRAAPLTKLYYSNEAPKTPNVTEKRQNERQEELDDDTRSETTQTTFTTDGVDTPRARESEDEEDADELIARVLENLHLKVAAVKRHKKVVAEVAKLRMLLAEKEADLAECERIMALEVEQISSG